MFGLTTSGPHRRIKSVQQIQAQRLLEFCPSTTHGASYIVRHRVLVLPPVLQSDLHTFHTFHERKSTPFEYRPIFGLIFRAQRSSNQLPIISNRASTCSFVSAFIFSLCLFIICYLLSLNSIWSERHSVSSEPQRKHMCVE